MDDTASEPTSPIVFPDDVGHVRYKYWGNRFIAFSDLGSLWKEIAEAITAQGGALDDRFGAGALEHYSNDRHTANPTMDHWLFSWPDVEPGRLLYHYTPPERLDQIVDSGSLRLGPLLSMRDPREFCEWDPQALIVRGTTTDVAAIRSTVTAIRRNTKIICFGRDDQPDDPPDEHADVFRRMMDPYNGRGYLRPRMWEQYGAVHAGACLIFDRLAIDRLFAERLAEEKEDAGSLLPNAIPFHDDVKYDDSSDQRTVAGQVGIVDDDYSLWDWVSSDDWIRQAFLTKDIDWFTEHEYRWGLMTSRPGDVFVPLDAGCLLGVVVGLKWSDEHNASLARFATRFEIGANVARAWWNPHFQHLECRLINFE